MLLPCARPAVTLRITTHVATVDRHVQLKFPTVGRMVTTRSGRFDFVFEPLFVEYFEREHYGLLKEVSTKAGSIQAS